MTKVLAQDLHHTPIGREVIVNRDDFFYPGAILDIEEISKTIRIGLIRTEETEITLLGVFCKHISHHLAQLTSRLVALRCRLCDFNRIVGKRRNIKVYQQFSPIGVGIGSHTPFTFGGKRCKFRD